MKKNAFLLAISLTTLIGCSNDTPTGTTANTTTNITAQVPTKISTYLTANYSVNPTSTSSIFSSISTIISLVSNFPSVSTSTTTSTVIDRAEQHIDNKNVKTYDIYLKRTTNTIGNTSVTDAIHLKFDNNEDINEIDDVDKLPATAIPPVITDYVKNHYPDNVITDWKLGSTYQQIQLNNDIKVNFTLTGDFTSISTQKTGYTEPNNEIVGETNISLTEIQTKIPAVATKYITDNFSTSKITSAKQEMENNVVTYVIYLDNNTIHLKFDSNGKIIEIYVASGVPSNLIPASISSYVTTNYSTTNNFITDWELKSTYQEIKLATGLELKFALNYQPIQ